MKRSKLGARRAARIAIKYGVPPHVAHLIAIIAWRKRVKYALAFALFEQESGFRHIFGHDVGGPYPGRKVTKALFQKLLDHIRAGGTSNGVGLGQITYGGYLLAHPGLWRMRSNIKFALGTIKDHIKNYGERTGLGVYNGGPTNPQLGYADQVLALKAKWLDRFNHH